MKNQNEKRSQNHTASPHHALIMWPQCCVSCKINGLRWVTLSGANTWAANLRLQDPFSGSLESRVSAQLGMGIVYASSLPALSACLLLFCPRAMAVWLLFLAVEGQPFPRPAHC